MEDFLKNLSDSKNLNNEEFLEKLFLKLNDFAIKSKNININGKFTMNDANNGNNGNDDNNHKINSKLHGYAIKLKDLTKTHLLTKNNTADKLSALSNISTKSTKSNKSKCRKYSSKSLRSKTISKSDYFETIQKDLEDKTMIRENYINLNKDISKKIPGSKLKIHSIDLEYKSPNLKSGSLRQAYILPECPRTIYEAGDLFWILFNQNIKLIISAHDWRENDIIADFWKHENVSQMPTRNGLQVTVCQCPNINFNNTQNDRYGLNNAEIVHSNLELVRGVGTSASATTTSAPAKVMHVTHIHYNGWKDGRSCPDEHLLNYLLDLIDMNTFGASGIKSVGSTEIENAQDANVEFSMNCKHSRNRSAVIIMCNFLRKYVRQEIGHGISLDDIVVNIPEIIYEFRKQRRKFLTKARQLKNVYFATFDYYTKLSNLKDILHTWTNFDPKVSNIIFQYSV